MRIQGTELDYDEDEAVGLDRFLTERTETKEKWAQRVWNCCRRQSEGEDIARVYIASDGQTWKKRAKKLWENKKKHRTKAFVKIRNDIEYA